MTILPAPGWLRGRSRPTVWLLAGVAAGAFTGCPQFGRMRRGPIRLVLWAQLALGDYRADEAGSAVCGLSGASHRPVMAGTAAGVAGLAFLAGLWLTMSVTWPVWSIFAAAGWVYWPMVRHSALSFRSRRRLARCRPPGRVVVVHTVASARPGAGARLLRQVTTEADRRGWTLALVAANEHLARYYEQFGFSATGQPVRMPSGEQAVPMTRHRAPIRLPGAG